MSASDQNIRRILDRAARDDSFCKELLAKRETALANEELPEPERLMLLAASEAQLTKMIEAARKKPWYARDLGVGWAGKVLIGGAALAAAASLAIPQTLGHSREVSAETEVRSCLRQIYLVEAQYHQEYGVYAPLHVLRDHKDIKYILEYYQHPGWYEIVLESNENTFTATARHKTRPGTRPALRIDPSGNIEEVGDDEP